VRILRAGKKKKAVYGKEMDELLQVRIRTKEGSKKSDLEAVNEKEEKLLTSTLPFND
jgi:hypothetical protein